jgi:hypothetical protein
MSERPPHIAEDAFDACLARIQRGELPVSQAVDMVAHLCLGALVGTDNAEMFRMRRFHPGMMDAVARSPFAHMGMPEQLQNVAKELSEHGWRVLHREILAHVQTVLRAPETHLTERERVRQMYDAAANVNDSLSIKRWIVNKEKSQREQSFFTDDEATAAVQAWEAQLAEWNKERKK